MEKNTCYECKKNINTITDIYNHASLYKDGKTIIIYFCNYKCWTDFSNKLNLNHK